ncbi:MAG: nucleotidyltransferase family protein [Deltaproteobacteria bacterium]|nr:nucleotidyltransferase family protein [Deltaproteobacteria bacterium]
MTQTPTLLLSCLRNDPPDVKIQNLRSFQETDWQDILQTSTRFRTTPYLYHTLKPLFPSLKVPADIKKQMQAVYYLSAARNMKVYQQILKLVTEFNKHNIDVILLKGTHLAQFVYGNIALRPMSDIDLLVKKADLAKASHILIDQGYSTKTKDLGISEAHLPPFRGKNKITIELHFNIYRWPLTERFAIDDLWKQAHATSLHGINVLTLSPEDLLIHICVHASILHGFEGGIKSFIDISRTVEHYGTALDWQRLLNISNQMKINNCLYLMLALTKKLIGLSVPEHIMVQLKPDNDMIMDSAEELIFANEAPAVMPVTTFISRLFSNEKKVEKIKILLKRSFPQKETMIHDESITRTSLSYYRIYLTRMGFLLKRHSHQIFKALLKDKDTTASIEYENRKNAIRDWLSS